MIAASGHVHEYNCKNLTNKEVIEKARGYVVIITHFVRLVNGTRYYS